MRMEVEIASAALSGISRTRPPAGQRGKKFRSLFGALDGFHQHVLRLLFQRRHELED